jgi:hypothetical protein
MKTEDTKTFRLREIPEIMRAFLEEYSSEECSDDRRLTIEFELEKMDMQFTDFLTGACTFLGECDANEGIWKSEIDRLREKQQSAKAKAERTRNFIKELMLRRGVEKIDTGLYNLSFRKSEAVVVTDEALLARVFIRAKTEVDKVAVKMAIKDGQIVNGAFIVSNKNLQIR